MVNFGVGPAFVLGVFLAVAGAGLYFLRSVRPELSRDHDIFFAAVGLVCGLILMFYGWRLEPALQFGQFLLAGTTIFFAYEAIKLRGIATEQARRSTPIVDEDRPTSRVYTKDAKLDDYETYDERRPRLQGARDRRPDYETEERSAPRNGRGTRPRSEESAKTRRSRPAPPSRDRYSDYNDAGTYEESDSPTNRARRSRPDYSDEPPARPRTRRTSRPADAGDYGTDFEVMPVDYQPIEGEEDPGNGYDRAEGDRNERPTRESRDYNRPARSRSSYDPMNYGQPYDDSEESEDDESGEVADQPPHRDRFDY